jgi:hypothetical protein
MQMLSLVLGAAVEIAARGKTFASRQMDAALVAAHHVLPGAALRRLVAPVDALAVDLQYPVGQQQAQDKDDDFCQMFASVRKSLKCAPTAAPRRVPGRQRRGLLQALAELHVVRSRSIAIASRKRRSVVNRLDRQVANGAGKTKMVGVRGFEPPTPASRTQYSTRLSYTPTWCRRFPGSTAGMLDLGRGILATESDFQNRPQRNQKRVQSITGPAPRLNVSALLFLDLGCYWDDGSGEPCARRSINASCCGRQTVARS